MDNVIDVINSTDQVFCNYNDTTSDDQESLTIISTSEWPCPNSERTIVANGIFDHEDGTFPNQASSNTISEIND